MPIKFIENAIYKRYARECDMTGKTYKQVQDILGYPSAISKELGQTKYIYEAYRYKDSIGHSVDNTTVRFIFIFKKDKVVEQSSQVLKLYKKFSLIR